MSSVTSSGEILHHALYMPYKLLMYCLLRSLFSLTTGDSLLSFSLSALLDRDSITEDLNSQMMHDCDMSIQYYFLVSKGVV